MTSGTLTDLDPPAAPERRWPFYLAWAVGGLVVGAVLLSHVPGPAMAAPSASPLQVAPIPVEPARP